MSRIRSTVVAVGLSALVGVLAGCPKSSGTPVAVPVLPTPAAAAAIDADPLALMPFGAVMVANLDVHTLANGSLGGDMAALSDRLLPFSKEIGLDTKRDLDHAYVGMYSFSGADTLAVLTGTFHPDKLEAKAQEGLKTPLGLVVASTYAGRRLYTVANYGFTALTEHTMLIGTETAIRRALDRIQSGTLKRELAPLMNDWCTKSGSPILVASDVTKQSFGKTVTNMLPFVQGVQYVRVSGRFNPDSSFGLSGALTYPDAQKATAGAEGLQSVPKSFAVMSALKFLGVDPLVRSMKVWPSGNDVDFQSVVDEKQARAIFHQLTDWISTPGSSMPTPQNDGTPGTSI